MDVQEEVLEAISERCRHPAGFRQFHDELRRTGYCAHPVRLSGRLDAVDGDTGEVRPTFSSDECADGVLLKACNNRRATRCPACALTYRDDARHLVRSGLIGGKGVPASVSEHPAVFATLTAPSFGAVHGAFEGRSRPCHPGSPKRRCRHGRPTACFAHHESDDAVVGQAICEECYRYDRHVIWHLLVTELWRRTTIYLRRHLARSLGIPESELTAEVGLNYTKVVEYQRRGAIHLHVVVRADGVGGHQPPPPEAVTAEMLCAALGAAARAVAVRYPMPLDGVTWHARWGDQLDLRPIGDPQGARRAAGYLAKYATKSSDDGGVLDRRLRPSDLATLAARGLPEHYQRLVRAAWRLGGRPELEEVRLRAWAHTLGYRGHWLTKSRRYSTTFGALREARHQHRLAEAGDRPDPWGRPRSAGACLLVGRWRYAGSGHTTPGDALLADGWAKGVAEDRQFAREAVATSP